ncbi:hypothetical protein KIW84_011290 [Lathyrus oleraceus]|uniref:Retrotransposon gag domain-containing protein n=1 Tax=Pisum sativum TaxID=3888 RepID=A0A9D4YM70_PEA|nr:hypothetical protein KIW84_011290 [Pisum sativum]
MVQNTRNARRGTSVGRDASRGVGRNVSGEATPEGVANIQIGREDHSHAGMNSQADTRDVRELVAAVLVQTQQNAQILKITRDHQLFQQQQRETVHEDTRLNSFLKVGEYTRKFESLLKYSKFYRLQPREEWMCEKYQDRLKYDIQRAVLPLHIMRFGELIERCLELEGIDNRKNRYGSRVPTRNNNHKGHFNRGHGGRTLQGGRPYQRPTPYHNQILGG